MLGVSPAFFFSSYSTEFTVHDYAKGLEVLKRMGFTGYQLEIFDKDRLGEWETGYRTVVHKADELGMQATQFVAHFLLAATADETSLLSDLGFEEMERVVEIVAHFNNCKTITLPLSPFSFPREAIVGSYSWNRLWERLCAKLLQFGNIVEAKGFRLGLEIVPGSLLGGTEGLLRFSQETGNTTIGYNFDTGHAWSSKENIATIPAKLAGRIYGTHLKDNFGNENLALPPGQGTIPWKSVINGLLANGYDGSFDLEIACSDPSTVEASYREGKMNIENILKGTKEASL
ncbi:MAG TPA: hypothetical protein DIW48_02475 [Sphaerochaeta sp.]|nr:hypothetical protein [Sphaerochaeta sp.]